MISGYKVPWASIHRLSSSFCWATTASRTVMKFSPTAIRFFWGSVRPAIAPRKLWLASSTMKLLKPWALYAFSTFALSFLRIKPLSMWSPRTLFWPKALFRRANATVESTPPERNRRTFLSFASFFMFSMITWRTVFWSQFTSMPQYFAKFSKIWFPHGVSFTSQWHWRLNRFLARFWRAA